MPKKHHFFYLTLIVCTIILGILSRIITGIPTFIGDILYASMIYFGMRFLFATTNIQKIAFFALVFCFCIEFQQLYRAEWILEIRRTLLGHYILGQDFFCWDLVYYCIGILVAYLIDSTIAKNYTTFNLK